MNFWIYAIALLAIPAAIISWPLLTGPAKDKISGLFVLLMVPLAGIMLYQNIGTPSAIHYQPTRPQQAAAEPAAHSAQQAQMDELVASLQQRMNENPDDPQGWLILGRSLKTMQRFQEAEAALANAYRLMPGNALVMIELAEAGLFASGQAVISPESRQLIEAALAIDPDQQKGLWLMGMISAQDGNDTQAIDYWNKLLGQLDPASGAAQSVTEQIQMAQTRMGQPVMTPPVAMPQAKPVAEQTPPPVQVAEAATTGVNIPVTITLSNDLAGSLTANAVLFVFVHPEGGVGMPLAGKRLDPRSLPLSLSFTDADLLMPGNSLQNFEKLDVSARISMAGVANIASGDVRAESVNVDTKSISAIALHLDQRVP